MTEPSSLAARLAERIRREGPLRFDVFQEAALYDPDGGYYARAERIGRTGDFVTGPSWHPAFGRTIARIARKVWEERASHALCSQIDVVDVGAGEGELLAAAHAALQSWGIREEFRLIGIERSAARRRLAAERVPSVTWLSSPEEISSPVSGLIVAYELFDALPARALFFDGEELLERRVTLTPDGAFDWIHAPCPDAGAILEALRRRGIHLLSNQKLEVRSGATDFARALAALLSQGLLLVFDYGAPARALYSAARPNGTLEAFASAGLHVAGPMSQARVLSAAGIGAELEDGFGEPISAERAAERNSIARLVAPGGMGESIRVLLASRGSHVKDTLLAWPEVVHSH